MTQAPKPHAVAHSATAGFRKDLDGGMPLSVVRPYAEHYLGRLRELPTSPERATAIAEAEAFLLEHPL